MWCCRLCFDQVPLRRQVMNHRSGLNQITRGRSGQGREVDQMERTVWNDEDAGDTGEVGLQRIPDPSPQFFGNTAIGEFTAWRGPAAGKRLLSDLSLHLRHQAVDVGRRPKRHNRRSGVTSQHERKIRGLSRSRSADGVIAWPGAVPVSYTHLTLPTS